MFQHLTDSSLPIPTFRLSDLKHEAREFQKLCTSREFWLQPTEVRERALDGLMLVYLQLEGTREELAEAVHVHKVAMGEYHARLVQLQRVIQDAFPTTPTTPRTVPVRPVVRHRIGA